MAQKCSRVWSKGSWFYQQKRPDLFLWSTCTVIVLLTQFALYMIYRYFWLGSGPSNIYIYTILLERGHPNDPQTRHTKPNFLGRNFPKRCLRCVCNTGLGLWNGRSCCKPKDTREMRCGDGRCTELWPQFSLFGIVEGGWRCNENIWKHEISIDQNPCYIQY